MGPVPAGRHVHQRPQRDRLRGQEQPAPGWAWKWDPRPIQAARQDRGQYDKHLQQLKALWPDVANITCPALVLRGADSEVLLPEDARELASRLPHGQWAEIPDAGHLVQRDNPSATTRALQEFLRYITY